MRNIPVRYVLLTAAILAMIVAALVMATGCPFGDGTARGFARRSRSHPSGQDGPSDSATTTQPSGTGENDNDARNRKRSDDPADAIDDAAPSILTILGALLGLPAVGVGAAAAWRTIRPARAITNLVHSIQAGRAEIKAHAAAGKYADGGDPLEDFDMTVGVLQDDATEKLVRTVKRKGKIRSIT